ncbi:MAG: serine/threonine-protein kinase [Mycobacteriales bacterium]
MTVPSRIERYRIDRRLGSGGFATVWLARDDLLESDVAVKVLADNWSNRLDVRSRFAEEARILRRADSDHIVRVHDIGELPDGRPYFVMTYADRGTLEERLERGTFTPEQALTCARGVARGLAVLHGLGVVHRDIKPSNVLFVTRQDEAGERVLIADLGLARAVAHASGFTMAAGTPGYMAPEQAIVGGAVGVPADVFGLGALLLHMLTGRRMGEVSTPPPGTPSALAAVIRRALEPEPGDRYASGAEIAAALDAVALPGPSLGWTVPFDRYREPWSQRLSLPADATQRYDAVPAEDPPPDEQRPGSGLSAPGSGGDPHAHLAGGRGDDEPRYGKAATHESRRGRWIGLGAGGLAVAAVAGTVIALHPFATQSTTVADAAGAVTVTVPDGWQKDVNPHGFALTRLGAAGRADGLGASPDIGRWQDAKSSTPGVLVGVSPALAAKPDDTLLGAVPHPGCTQSGGRTGSFDASRWTSRAWTCARTKFDTAVIRTAGSKPVVYVQVKESVGDDYLPGILGSITLK